MTTFKIVPVCLKVSTLPVVWQWPRVRTWRASELSWPRLDNRGLVRSSWVIRAEEAARTKLVLYDILRLVRNTTVRCATPSVTRWLWRLALWRNRHMQRFARLHHILCIRHIMNKQLRCNYIYFWFIYNYNIFNNNYNIFNIIIFTFV